jgi:hypothetical protein
MIFINRKGKEAGSIPRQKGKIRSKRQYDFGMCFMDVARFEPVGLSRKPVRLPNMPPIPFT